MSVDTRDLIARARRVTSCSSLSRIGLIALVVVTAAGCRSTRIDYLPSATLSPVKAKGVVLQVLEEQPLGFAPAKAEVSYDKMTTAHARSGLKTVVYFNSINEMDLYLDRRGNYYFVRVFDTAGGFRLRVWMRELDKGKSFMDGLQTLMLNAHARKDDAELRAKQERLEKLREITGEIEQIRKERSDEQRKELELEADEPEQAR